MTGNWVNKLKCYCLLVINLKVHGLNKFDFALKLNLAAKCDLQCTCAQLKNVYFPSPIDTHITCSHACQACIHV